VPSFSFKPSFPAKSGIQPVRVKDAFGAIGQTVWSPAFARLMLNVRNLLRHAVYNAPTNAVTSHPVAVTPDLHLLLACRPANPHRILKPATGAQIF
jgi:hypothetical protein